MLNLFLGWTVSLGSLGFYLVGYLLPEVRRKKDAIWSGVGLIYALALLTNGDRISGGLLVGQLASVTLIGWFGWQTLQQRRDLSDAVAQTPIPNSVQNVFPFLKQGWKRLRATYTSPEDDSGDLLASGFKKASALLAGRSDAAEPFNAASTRSKPEATPIHSEEKEDWADEQPDSSSVPEVSVNPSIETNLTAPESVEEAAAEGVEVIASHQESAPLEETPVTSVENALSTSTSEVTPSVREEVQVIEEVIPAQVQTASEEQVTSSIQESDSHSFSSPIGEEEWPPKEVDDTGHHES